MVHVWYGASVGIKKQGQQITAVPVLIMGFSLLSASEFLQTEKWRCAKQ